MQVRGCTSGTTLLEKNHGSGVHRRNHLFGLRMSSGPPTSLPTSYSTVLMSFRECPGVVPEGVLPFGACRSGTYTPILRNPKNIRHRPPCFSISSPLPSTSPPSPSVSLPRSGRARPLAAFLGSRRDPTPRTSPSPAPGCRRGTACLGRNRPLDPLRRSKKQRGGVEESALRADSQQGVGRVLRMAG